MTPERWQQVKEVFNSAIQFRPEERGAFLSRACSGDDDLRSEVEALIASHEKTGSFIDAPAYQAAAESLVTEKAELQPGQSIGSYEILSFVSRGGMGEVYLAHDGRLSRKVALKLLPVSFTTNLDRLRRFEQEARAVSALNHPNITWSHDGDKIAFAGQRNGVWNIYWISRGTKAQKQLTNYSKLNAFVRYPAWSPLGNQIVYEYAETTGNIWLAELK